MPASMAAAALKIWMAWSPAVNACAVASGATVLRSSSFSFTAMSLANLLRSLASKPPSDWACAVMSVQTAIVCGVKSHALVLWHGCDLRGLSLPPSSAGR